MFGIVFGGVMVRGKNSPRSIFRLAALPLVLAGVVSNNAYAALAPVEESKPMGKSAASRTVISKVSGEPVSVSSSGEDDFNSTAHLLNIIDQLRQEMMEVRGLLEEHAFRIEQIQQENRDRYLDLDERISRLNDLAGKAAESNLVTNSKPLIANASVDSTEKKKDQSIVRAEEAAYQSAFNFIREKRFAEARKALLEHLKTYPDGHYVGNARYWLGEVDMAQGRYNDAKESFQIILDDFPKSSKVPDASYKLGRVYDLLGNQKKARELLESVIQKYPDSAAARLSDTYLRTMGDT